MHAWRFWKLAKPHHSLKPAEPTEKEPNADQRMRQSIRRCASPSAGYGSEPRVQSGTTGRYVYVDNFR